MIRITIVPGKPSQHGQKAGGTQRDYAEATWEGKRFQARLFRPIADVCRQLLDARCPDQPWQAFLPDGTPSLKAKSLSRYAAKQKEPNDINEIYEAA